MNSNLCLYFHHALSNSEWLSHHKRRRTTFVKTIVTSTDGQHTTETLHTMPIDTDIRRKKEIMVGQTVRLAMGQAYSIPFSMVTRKGCSVVIEVWGELHAKSNAQETVLRKEAKRMLLGRTTSMKSEDMHINIRSNRPTATEIGYGNKDDAKPSTEALGGSKNEAATADDADGATKVETSASATPGNEDGATKEATTEETVAPATTALQKIWPLYQRNPSIIVGQLKGNILGLQCCVYLFWVNVELTF